MWKTVLVAIWFGIKPTLLSKKVQTAIITGLVTLGARVGLQLNTETVALLIAPFLAAIGSQGYADTKKPCPHCAAAASATTLPPAAETVSPEPPK